MRTGSNFPSALFDPEDLVALMGDFKASASYRVIDCRASLGDPDFGRAAFAERHVSGAVFADLDRDMAAPPGEAGRHPLPDRDDFAALLGSWGVTYETHLIAYDADAGAYACRFWWLARWLGHDKVSVLDGGLAAWDDIGGPTDAEVAELEPSSYAPRRPLTRHLNADQIQNGDHVLVDARAQERFDGVKEPIDFKAGHIPGAVCRPFDGNLNAAGRFDSDSSRFDDLPDGDVVCYCGSGVTATHNIFAMCLAGLPEPALYPGSWSEWIRDPSRPTTP